jgi:hypothetical protein
VTFTRRPKIDESRCSKTSRACASQTARIRSLLRASLMSRFVVAKEPYAIRTIRLGWPRERGRSAGYGLDKRWCRVLQLQEEVHVATCQAAAEGLQNKVLRVVVTVSFIARLFDVLDNGQYCHELGGSCIAGRVPILHASCMHTWEDLGSLAVLDARQEEDSRVRSSTCAMVFNDPLSRWWYRLRCIHKM